MNGAPPAKAWVWDGVEPIACRQAMLPNERLSQSMPESVEGLLVIKREMLDALEEYYGAITTATRFSDAVTIDGERLLGIADLYSAVMTRLEAVSFEITTR